MVLFGSFSSSLANLCLSLFERLIVEKLEVWKSRQELFTPYQFSFVTGWGTEDAVLEVVQYVRGSQARYVAAILLDIKGAFDGAVLRRLRMLDCPRLYYEIVKSYFSERKVECCATGEVVVQDVDQGCPQGSVLGPFL